MYLLDANVLITASNYYYAIDQVPEYWEWLRHQGHSDNVKIPLEILDEVKAGRTEDDLLYDWIRQDHNEEALLLGEQVDPALVQRVVNEGYANDLTDDELDLIGRDPFLIAYALVEGSRCVVTTEVSRPSATRHNRKIPDVCQTLAVSCQNPFDVYRALGFSTSWRA